MGWMPLSLVGIAMGQVACGVELQAEGEGIAKRGDHPSRNALGFAVIDWS